MITINIKKNANCKDKTDMSCFISFPYDTTVLDVVRSFSMRHWDKDNKTWEVPFKYFGEFIDKLSDYEFEINGPSVISIPTAEVPKNFSFKTKPFEHQIDGFRFGLENTAWLLGDEQGLGKTKQVIDIAVAKKLQKGYEHCLIVCGVNGLKWNWLNDYALPIALLCGMASAIPLTAWLG